MREDVAKVFAFDRARQSRTNTAHAGMGTHTTPGTAHTWGTPTQLIASTPFDSAWLYFRTTTATSAAATRTDTLCTIYIGSAGNEVPLIGPFCLGYRPSTSNILLPVYVPAGSRISIAYKSNRTSLGIVSIVELYGSAPRLDWGWPTRWVSYGLVDDASNSRGTIVTPGTSNAWGSWTNLGTTAYAHDLWMPNIDGGTQTVMTALNYRSQFAIANTTDAATQVTNGTVLEGPMWATTTSEVINDAVDFGQWIQGFVNNGLLYVPKASSADLSGRVMCSGTPDANAVSLSVLAAVA